MTRWTGNTPTEGRNPHSRKDRGRTIRKKSRVARVFARKDVSIPCKQSLLARSGLCFILAIMKPCQKIITRFAPSPTGLLHAGHAYAARFAEQMARENNGTFLLRIEDIDDTRCRAEFEAAIFKDLTDLGLVWKHPVRRQSEHMADYQTALDTLSSKKLLYPCFCTRKDIQKEIDAAQGAPHVNTSPDGPVYPGRCRNLTRQQQTEKIKAGIPFALRLDMSRATKMTGPLTWTDRGKGTIQATPEIFGDVVLARKDTPTSYHLAATYDDHIQNVSLVTRGQDLFAATHVHRLLQALLDLRVPHYHHHELLLDQDGQRFTKRNHSQPIRALLQSGHDPDHIGRIRPDHIGRLNIHHP